MWQSLSFCQITLLSLRKLLLHRALWLTPAQRIPECSRRQYTEYGCLYFGERFPPMILATMLLRCGFCCSYFTINYLAGIHFILRSNKRGPVASAILLRFAGKLLTALLHKLRRCRAFGIRLFFCSVRKAVTIAAKPYISAPLLRM